MIIIKFNYRMNNKLIKIIKKRICNGIIANAYTLSDFEQQPRHSIFVVYTFVHFNLLHISLYCWKAYIIYIIHIVQLRERETSFYMTEISVNVNNHGKGNTMLSSARPSLLRAIDWLLSSLPINCLLFYNEDSETVRLLDIQHHKCICIVEFCLCFQTNVLFRCICQLKIVSLEKKMNN